MFWRAQQNMGRRGVANFYNYSVWYGVFYMKLRLNDYTQESFIVCCSRCGNYAPVMPVIKKKESRKNIHV